MPGSVPRDAALTRHLWTRYGVDVLGMTPLDAGVWRVGRADGPDWVAREFPNRALADVIGDAAVLTALGDAGFPAERCAHPEPVSEFGTGAVLVTDWVEGEPSDGRGRTYGVLGALLGRLHSHPAQTLRAGGAWHHLSPIGGPRAEIDAAIALYEQTEAKVRPEHLDVYEQMLDALEHLDDAADLPHAFVHPDFVPANAITTPDDGRVIVDWAGAGRGPRLWSLAFLTWAAAARDPRLLTASITRYARHVELSTDELDRLEGVIPGRALTIDVWSYAHGRCSLNDVARRWEANRRIGERAAAQVRAELGG
jgi:Ser/Thr protein kinase RdoA (MazF antagonist)